MSYKCFHEFFVNEIWIGMLPHLTIFFVVFGVFAYFGLRLIEACVKKLLPNYTTELESGKFTLVEFNNFFKLDVNKLIYFVLLNGIFTFFYFLYWSSVGNKGIHFLKEPSLNTAIDAVYFSVTTGTTLGYGDITPKSYFIKVLSVMQQLTNLVGISIVIGSIGGAIKNVGKGQGGPESPEGNPPPSNPPMDEGRGTENPEGPRGNNEIEEINKNINGLDEKLDILLERYPYIYYWHRELFEVLSDLKLDLKKTEADNPELALKIEKALKLLSNL